MLKNLGLLIIVIRFCLLGSDINSLLISSDGEITAEVRDAFIKEKKSQMVKAASNKGYNIRQSTITLIDNSTLLKYGVYGTFSEADPYILRNLDSLLIYAENDNNPTFWVGRENLLLAAAIGRRGLGVGEHKVVYGETGSSTTNTLNGDALDFKKAEAEGLTFGEFRARQYNDNENEKKFRREKYAKVLSALQDSIMGWVGKIETPAIDKGENFLGPGYKAGVLQKDYFTYAKVYATESLKVKIVEMLMAEGYNFGIYSALNDLKEMYSPSMYDHEMQMPVYEFFRDLTKWQETPKEELNWNPLVTQASKEKMKHPWYRLSDDKPWQLLIPLSRSMRPNEMKWIQENYLGYHTQVDKSSTDKTQVYAATVNAYGPYRKGDLNAYKLISYPVGGYVFLGVVGGVCGTMSSLMQQSYGVMGKPVIKAAQPGHSNAITFTINDYWHYSTTAQSIDSDENTTTYDYLHSHVRVKYVHIKGLAYGVNFDKESWLKMRISYSLWKEMDTHEKEQIGVEMMAKALEGNAGYPEAFYALLQYCLETDGQLFVSTFNRIIDAINSKAKTLDKSHRGYIESASYRDLLIWHLLEDYFKSNSEWPVASTNILVEWLKTFILEKKPSKTGADYSSQPDRLWNISNEAKKAIAVALDRRVASDLKITPPKLLDDVLAVNYQDAGRLIDGKTDERYRTIIGKHVAVETPYEFIFTFPRVLPIETMEMYHETGNNDYTHHAKDVEVYWSLDSITWSGPIKERFTTDKYQKLNFFPDTIIIPKDSVEIIDSSGIVIDYEIVPADTQITPQATKMKYLKYVPKSSHSGSTFAGIVAGEFWFYYKPDLSVSLVKEKNVNQKCILAENNLLISGYSLEPLKILNVKGQIVAKIEPQVMDGNIKYDISEMNLGTSMYILFPPKELGLRPVKYTK